MTNDSVRHNMKYECITDMRFPNSYESKSVRYLIYRYGMMYVVVFGDGSG